MKPIDYETLMSNVAQMINLLEFDAMRSSGKAKMNSQHLHSLYELHERYEVLLKAKPVPKPTEKKEG